MFGGYCHRPQQSICLPATIKHHLFLPFFPNTASQLFPCTGSCIIYWIYWIHHQIIILSLVWWCRTIECVWERVSVRCGNVCVWVCVPSVHSCFVYILLVMLVWSEYGPTSYHHYASDNKWLFSLSHYFPPHTPTKAPPFLTIFGSTQSYSLSLSLSLIGKLIYC